MAQTIDQGVTFGEWLLVQKGGGALARLIAAAKADPAFPQRGSPDDVRRRLQEMQADGDLLAVIDDAETEWMGY